jgi:hypothetical protein
MLSVLLLSVSLAAAPPTKSHAAEVLRSHCLLWAADPTNPWALAHGVKTLGPGFLASDGRKASDVIISDFLLKNVLPDGGVGAGAPYGFVRYAPDKTPVEPHTNLNTKALVVDAHLPLTTKFKAKFGPVTLKQLVDSAKAGFRHVPSSAEYWQDVGWTLGIFAATEKPGTKWKTADGAEINLDVVFDDALTELEKETTELKAGLDQHLPKVDKRKQGVYAHSCGGLHFVQGVLAWARHPGVKKKWGARLDSQVLIHFYRLESERVQYEAAYQQALSGMPQFKLPILVQMVKFYGHWLETVGHFRGDFGWKPNDAQKIDVNRAKAFLDLAVRNLEGEGALQKMLELKKTVPQVYLDLIGDSCHAAHGLAEFP